MIAIIVLSSFLFTTEKCHQHFRNFSGLEREAISKTFADYSSAIRTKQPDVSQLPVQRNDSVGHARTRGTLVLTAALHVLLLDA